MTSSRHHRFPIKANISLDVEIQGHPVSVRSRGRLVTIRVVNWMSLYPLFRYMRSSSTLRAIPLQMEKMGHLTGLKFQIVYGNVRLMTIGAGERATILKSILGIRS